MAINYGCYIAYQHAENLANEDAQKIKENETFQMSRYLDELKDLADKSSSRGS